MSHDREARGPDYRGSSVGEMGDVRAATALWDGWAEEADSWGWGPDAKPERAQRRPFPRQAIGPAGGRRRRTDPGAGPALWLAAAGLVLLPVGVGVILAACSVAAGCRAENRIAAAGRPMRGKRSIEIASILNHITLALAVIAVSVVVVLALL